MSPTQKKILLAVKKNPSASNRELADWLNVPASNVSRYINRSIEQGVIKKTAPEVKINKQNLYCCTPTMRKVLAAYKKNPTGSTKDIGDAIEMHQNGVAVYLRNAELLGLIERRAAEVIFLQELPEQAIDGRKTRIHKPSQDPELVAYRKLISDSCKKFNQYIRNLYNATNKRLTTNDTNESRTTKPKSKTNRCLNGGYFMG